MKTVDERLDAIAAEVERIATIISAIPSPEELETRNRARDEANLAAQKAHEKSERARLAAWRKNRPWRSKKEMRADPWLKEIKTELRKIPDMMAEGLDLDRIVAAGEAIHEARAAELAAMEESTIRQPITMPLQVVPKTEDVTAQFWIERKAALSTFRLNLHVRLADVERELNACNAMLTEHRTIKTNGAEHGHDAA